jgi:hypothetical protein
MIQGATVNWPKAWHLFSESMRDIGLLLFVFAPLDTLLKSGHGSREDWLIAACVGFDGITLIPVGIVVESLT